MFIHKVYLTLFVNTWHWLAAGLGMGLTALALVWFMGKRLGVSGGFVNLFSSGKNASLPWKVWFIVGLPLGGLLATIGDWSWTLTYGQLDALTYGAFWIKALWLFLSGVLLGFGARWAGGDNNHHTIMGVALGNKMSILATIAFMAAGILVTNILFRAVM